MVNIILKYYFMCRIVMLERQKEVICMYYYLDILALNEYKYIYII